MRKNSVVTVYVSHFGMSKHCVIFYQRLVYATAALFVTDIMVMERDETHSRTTFELVTTSL